MEDPQINKYLFKIYSQVNGNCSSMRFEDFEHKLAYLEGCKNDILFLQRDRCQFFFLM